MDNPWGSSDATSEQEDTWSQPKGFGAAHDDHEADVSATSWSTPQWNEADESHGSLWGPAAMDMDEGGWGSSTYEGIDLGSSGIGPSAPSPPQLSSPLQATPTFQPPSSVEEHQNLTTPHKDAFTLSAMSESISQMVDSSSSAFVEHSPFAEASAFTEPSTFGYTKEPPPSDLPAPISLAHTVEEDPFQARPDSPEVFGTFELGASMAQVEEPTWFSTPSVAHPEGFGASQWEGDAWSSDVPEMSQPIDEWEAAKVDKQKRDARVVSIKRRSNVI